MGQKLLGVLVEEIAQEFPSVDTQENILTPRHYDMYRKTLRRFY